MSSKKPRYPGALIFNVWWNLGLSDENRDDEPERFQVAMDDLESCDPAVEELRDTSKDDYFGPWD